jgi:hypothetical protein
VRSSPTARAVLPALALGLAIGSPVAAAGTPHDARGRKIDGHALGRIVQCLKDSSPPVRATPSSPARACGAVVFDADEGRDAVVIEDLKMSSCAANAHADMKDPRSFAYVHALALPLTEVTGVEQEGGLPQGLWDLSWRVAASFIPETEDIVLIVNQVRFRSQDQLHIHLVRLKPGAKAEILRPKPGSGRVPPVYIDRLSGSPDPVWLAAERASGRGLKSGAFGVAVVYDEERKKYAVVAVEGNAEAEFAVRCPAGANAP